MNISFTLRSKGLFFVMFLKDEEVVTKVIDEEISFSQTPLEALIRLVQKNKPRSIE